jgi:hypothetical protein
MASASRTQSAGSANLPSSDFSSSPVDPLSEKLSVQRAVLDYLLDTPESAEEEIAAAKAEIADLERQIAQAGSKGLFSEKLRPLFLQSTDQRICYP